MREKGHDPERASTRQSRAEGGKRNGGETCEMRGTAMDSLDEMARRRGVGDGEV